LPAHYDNDKRTRHLSLILNRSHDESKRQTTPRHLFDPTRFFEFSGCALIALKLFAAREIFKIGSAIADVRNPFRVLTPEEGKILLKICRFLLPNPFDFENADRWVVNEIDVFLDSFPNKRAQVFKDLLLTFNNPWSLINLGWLAQDPFLEMKDSECVQYLEAWQKHPWSKMRAAYLALKRIILGTYYTAPQTWSSIGYPGVPDVRELSEKIGEFDG